MKTLKFRQELAKLIISGNKTSTWRLFDDKDLSKGDDVQLVVWENGQEFASATITKTLERPLGELSDEDKFGHESYVNDKEMYKTYSGYYNKKVGPETIAKLIWFDIKNTIPETVV